MAIAASRPLDMPRQQAFWLLHLAGWSAYFAQGCLYAVAHGKPSGYWVVPATATMGALVTLGLRFVLRSYWNLPPRRLLALMIPLVLASSAAIDFVTREALVDFCETCRPTTRLEFVAYSLGYIYVVLAWVGAYMGIKYYRQLQGETERALAARSMAEPCCGCRQMRATPLASSSKRARRYWRRELAAGQSKPAGNVTGSVCTSLRPWARQRNGRATTRAVTRAAAGLPGRPIHGLPETLPKASGLPGCIFNFHRCSSPSSRIACLR